MKKEFNQQACWIINALGGTSATARLCNVEPPSVTEWKYKGIPKARLMFLRLARPDIFAEIKSAGSTIEKEEADRRDGQRRTEERRNGDRRAEGDQNRM